LRLVETLCLLAFASGAANVLSAPRKGAPKSAAAAAVKAPVETVFVAVAPPAPAPVRESRSSEPARDPDARRNESAFSTGPTRAYDQAFGLNIGYYAAEVLGTNPFTNVNWDLYPAGQAFFFQFTSGIGTVQSDFAESIIGGTQTPHSFMIAGEALGGYSLSGLTRGEGRSGGLFPYFVGGITAVWQGGIPNIGAVLGFGNRMKVPFMSKNNRYALNYGVRDHIYSQKLKTEPSITQNLVLLAGVQKYF
jgi:ABC-type transport system substrate-binding protein